MANIAMLMVNEDYLYQGTHLMFLQNIRENGGLWHSDACNGKKYPGATIHRDCATQIPMNMYKGRVLAQNSLTNAY